MARKGDGLLTYFKMNELQEKKEVEQFKEKRS